MLPRNARPVWPKSLPCCSHSVATCRYVTCTVSPRYSFEPTLLFRCRCRCRAPAPSRRFCPPGTARGLRLFRPVCHLFAAVPRRLFCGPSAAVVSTSVCCRCHCVDGERVLIAVSRLRRFTAVCGPSHPLFRFSLLRPSRYGSPRCGNGSLRRWRRSGRSCWGCCPVLSQAALLSCFLVKAVLSAPPARSVCPVAAALVAPYWPSRNGDAVLFGACRSAPRLSGDVCRGAAAGDLLACTVQCHDFAHARQRCSVVTIDQSHPCYDEKVIVPRGCRIIDE